MANRNRSDTQKSAGNNNTFNPLQLLSGLLSGVDPSQIGVPGYATGKVLMNAMSPENSPINRVQEKTVKAVEKKVSDQAVEAIDAGANPKDVLLKLATMFSTEQPQGQQPAVQQQPVQQPAQPQVQPDLNQALAGDQKRLGQKVGSALNVPLQAISDVLTPLLGTVGATANSVLGAIPASEDMKLQRSQRMLNEQELAGMKPLQAGEREKLDLESQAKVQEDYQKSMGDFFTNIRNPEPLSNEAATNVNLSTSVVKDIANLKEILSLDKNALSKLATPGSKSGQMVRDLVKRLKANIVAMRGGKTLTANEEKIISSLLPNRGFSAYLQDPTSVNFLLDSLSDDANRQINLLNPSQKTRDLVNALQGKYSDEEIYDALKRKGLI